MTGKPLDWPKAIVFDLDGTLIDSVPDIAAALNRATEKHHIQPFSTDEVREMVGGGVPQLVQRALVARGLPVDGLKPLVQDFIGFYGENLTTRTQVYDGARELLERLRGEGRQLGVCTNKHHGLTLAILEKLDLAQYFGSIVGERDGHKRKPDAAPLLEVIAALGASPDAALMVGDSETDIACARNAHVPVVAVTFGYARVPPQKLGADALIVKLADLPGSFAALTPSSGQPKAG